MHESNDPGKKISLIIPTLNEEKLIKRTISQFTEELKNKFSIEVIVSDGGSSDSTLDIITGSVDKVKHLEHNLAEGHNRQNISQGRNKGAEISQGDVLIFMNADTLIHNIDSFFEKINQILSDDRVSAIACPVYVFPEEEKLSDKLFHGFYNNYVRMLNLMFMGMGRGECHIIKRKKFFEEGGYNEKLIAGEDFDLYRRLRKSGKVIFRKDLIIFESPRRYRKYGYRKVFMDWTRNSISITLFGRSISEDWEAVR
jgi:glycosyltransferase involved in cell wall biosynthesis